MRPPRHRPMGARLWRQTPRWGRLWWPEEGDTTHLQLARRRLRAIAPRRTAPEVGKQWGDRAIKTSPDGGTSWELGAAVGASGVGWWRRPGSQYGRHGGRVYFCVLVVVCCVCCVSPSSQKKAKDRWFEQFELPCKFGRWSTDEGQTLLDYVLGFIKAKRLR